MNNMTRLESIVAELPEARRVDIEQWGRHPTFRVGAKNFVPTNPVARRFGIRQLP